MFTLNNETVNIWTHVVGFVYFALLLIDDNILLIPLLPLLSPPLPSPLSTYRPCI